MKKFVCLLMAAMLALSLGVSVFAVQTACEHIFSPKTITNQVACCEAEIQTLQVCKKCGWTEIISERTAPNDIHLGRLAYEYNIIDGVEYRCQYCTECNEIISCSRA